MSSTHKRRTKFRLSFLSISIFIITVSHNAFADNDSDQSTINSNENVLVNGLLVNKSGNDAGDLPSTTLDTITVIAEKTDSSEETDEYVYYRPKSATGLTLAPKLTPQSVTTITAQQIKDQNVETLNEVLEITPGISTANFDGGKTSASARGFEIYQYRIDGQKVSYTGGWQIGEDITSTALYDRAEVVRGASGLTAGSGRPSASINLVRKRANSRVPTVTFSLNADDYETYGGSIDATTPVTDDGNIRTRFVAEYKEGDTYIERENKKRAVLYSVIDADITDNTTVSGGISYQDNELRSAMWGALPAYWSNGSEAEWDVSKNASVDWVNWDSNHLTYFGSLEHDISDDWHFELKGSRSEIEGNSKLFYLLGNTVDKQTGLGLKEYNGRYDIEHNIDNVQASVDGYFDALSQTHEVRFGGSYNKNEEIGFGYTATPNLSPLGNFFEWDGSHPEPTWSDRKLLSDITIKEKSLFASGRFQLADPLAVILGSRVTNFEAKGISMGAKVNISHDEVWVPYVGTTFDINNNHTLFASYTSIFQPQQKKDINNNYLDPIDGDSYEMGIKSSNDLETLQTQFSVFKIEQDKLAQEDGQKKIPGTSPPEQAYYEAEGATSTGIDVEVTGKISPNWQTSIGYTQFNAEDANGKTVNSGYPDRLFKLFTTYDASSWVNGLTLGAGVNWSDERYTVLTNPATQLDEKRIQGDVALVNLMARYKMTDSLALQLNVDNLFDKKYIDSVNFSQIYYGEPLTISGKLAYQF